MTVAARDWLHVRVVLHSGRSETASTIFPYSLSFPSWEPGRPASPPGRPIREEPAMFIGFGTIVLIVIIVLIIMFVRRH